jgi:hypothetical protein
MWIFVVGVSLFLGLCHACVLPVMSHHTLAFEGGTFIVAIMRKRNETIRNTTFP